MYTKTEYIQQQGSRVNVCKTGQFCMYVYIPHRVLYIPHGVVYIPHRVVYISHVEFCISHVEFCICHIELCIYPVNEPRATLQRCLANLPILPYCGTGIAILERVCLCVYVCVYVCIYINIHIKHMHYSLSQLTFLHTAVLV